MAAMDRLLNAMKQQSSSLDQGQGQPRFGIVSSFDPAAYTVRVLLQPENVLSGWLPVLSQWVGAGWGLVAPPSPGDQVIVLTQEGDAEHGLVSRIRSSPDSLYDLAQSITISSENRGRFMGSPHLQPLVLTDPERA